MKEPYMETSTHTLTRNDTDVRMPGMYAVVVYNDEITTMDFVVDILMRVFHHRSLEASNIMMDIHQQGQGIAGIYTYDIAVTKKAHTDRLSAEKGFPLKLTVQEAM
jgi:ATP-dependent Clp protease adaptor protein ClpS